MALYWPHSIKQAQEIALSHCSTEEHPKPLNLLIETVDSQKLAEKLNKECHKLSRI